MTTVVTGAAGALGDTVVRSLTAAGHRVVAIDRVANRRGVPEGVIELTFEGSDAGRWSDAAGHAPTGLVLVAGGWQGGGPLHARTDDAVWNAMLAMNLETVHRALRAVLPGMVERRSGSVVVVGARVVLRPESGAGAAEYVATKSAVVALAQAVAAEVLPSGVRVNAVLPSTIDTPANRAAMPDVDPSRWVGATSLAGVIAFLLSDAARDISGAAIPVYGRG